MLDMKEQITHRVRLVILVGLGIALLAANIFITYQFLTRPFPIHHDFWSRWEGARGFFMEGRSPYSAETSRQIQIHIYGRAATGNEDPAHFAYPFYTVFIVAPTVFTDFAWASAIWMVFLEICLMGALLLLLDLHHWKVPIGLFGALALWSLGDYFAGRGLIFGQLSHVVYLLQIVTIWGLVNRRDVPAGVALAISTLKPQMGYLIVPFLLLWGLRERRGAFVITFTATFSTLLLASSLLQPDWFGAWITQASQYPQYTAAAYPDTGSPVWILIQNYLGLGHAVEWTLTGALLVLLGWAWYTILIERRQERWLWVCTLTLVIGHLIALRTATPHYVVFNLALIFYFRELHQRTGKWAVIAALLTLSLFSWAQFLITVQGRNRLEDPSMFLPLPFALLVVLLLTRRLWWEKGINRL